jgi:hypothetical protein
MASTKQQDLHGKYETADLHGKYETADLHDKSALFRGHVAVHRAQREVSLVHVVRQPIDTATRVAVDDCLRDGQRLVQIAQGFQLIAILINGL